MLSCCHDGPRTTVIYRSGKADALGEGWDVLYFVYKQAQSGALRIANSFMIARDASGKIMRKTDSDPERWVVVKDPEDVLRFQCCFDDRDRLVAEQAAKVS
jgi:hypothetical protein